ncbi:MAG: hypothetical protein JWO94_918, partial [Verrucomicrobiaceae bacterium]|nr:hypothetical protein [Verrucomicrobiaceae bacterium]
MFESKPYVLNEGPSSGELKLYMILLGSKAPGRHVEQHDYFFGIGRSLKELVPAMKAFWREAGTSLHLDGWREVTAVEGHRVKIVLQSTDPLPPEEKRLFFINLGGYQEGRFQEQHYTVLTVKENRDLAFKEAKSTLFFKEKTFKGPGSFGASAHIDDRYGIDVDDLYEIKDILTPSQKELYRIELVPSDDLAD